VRKQTEGQVQENSTLRGQLSICEKYISGDALRLGSKGRYGSFHLWINVQVAGKTV